MRFPVEIAERSAVDGSFKENSVGVIPSSAVCGWRITIYDGKCGLEAPT